MLPEIITVWPQIWEMEEWEVFLLRFFYTVWESGLVFIGSRILEFQRYRVPGYTYKLTATQMVTVATEDTQMMENFSACCLGCVSYGLYYTCSLMPLLSHQMLELGE